MKWKELARTWPWCLQGFNHIGWEKAVCTFAPWDQFPSLCGVYLLTPQVHLLRTLACQFKDMAHTTRVPPPWMHITVPTPPHSTSARILTRGDTSFLNSLCPPSLPGSVILLMTGWLLWKWLNCHKIIPEGGTHASEGTWAVYSIHLQTRCNPHLVTRSFNRSSQKYNWAMRNAITSGLRLAFS